MSPALLLNSCSFDILHPYADLSTIPLLWADWAPFTVATQFVSSQASWLQRQQQGGGKPQCTRHQTELGSLASRAGAPGKVQWLIVHSHRGSSMSLSPCCQSRTVPLSVESSQTHVCLRRSRNWGSREKESGIAGEREIESMKNSHRPVKAKWTPGLVPVHVGGRGGEDTSKVSNFTPKSCALEKEITKEIPPKRRKEKSSKIQQVWLKGKEF